MTMFTFLILFYIFMLALGILPPIVTRYLILRKPVRRLVALIITVVFMIPFHPILSHFWGYDGSSRDIVFFGLISFIILCAKTPKKTPEIPDSNVTPKDRP